MCNFDTLKIFTRHFGGVHDKGQNLQKDIDIVKQNMNFFWRK